MSPQVRDTQKRMWQAVKSSSLPVYLVGGTALAFQYHHRESEDLDFFCQREHWSHSLHTQLAKRITTVTGFQRTLLAEQRNKRMVGMARYEFKTDTDLVIKVDVVQDHDLLLWPPEDGVASTDDLYLRKIRAAIGWKTTRSVTGRLMAGRQALKDLYDLWWLSAHIMALHEWFPQHLQRTDYARFVPWLVWATTADPLTAVQLLKIVPECDDARLMRATIRTHMQHQADQLNRKFMS